MTEVCHQIFGGWEEQTMFTKEQNMDLQVKIKKTIYGVKTHRLSGEEKVSNTTFSKEGHAYRLGTWKDQSLLISLKKVQQ